MGTCRLHETHLIQRNTNNFSGRYVICKESHRQIILLVAVYLNQVHTDLFAVL